MSRDLELVLFAGRAERVERARAAGITSLIIDLEWRGKQARQEGAGTEINRQQTADLEVLVAAGIPRRYCRLNAPGSWCSDELEGAIAAGANHLLLPMVRSAREVEDFLRRVDGRCAAGILVETTEAVAAATELARLPVDSVYVGLNDLAIARRSASLFDALVDGTVERVRQAFGTVRFGVAGVTTVDAGAPIPCRLLLAEMARLETDFSFLRRSFLRDAADRRWLTELAAIQQLWNRLQRRGCADVEADREALARVVAATRCAP